MGAVGNWELRKEDKGQRTKGTGSVFGARMKLLTTNLRTYGSKGKGLRAKGSGKIMPPTQPRPTQLRTLPLRNHATLRPPSTQLHPEFPHDPQSTTHDSFLGEPSSHWISFPCFRTSSLLYCSAASRSDMSIPSSFPSCRMERVSLGRHFPPYPR